MGVTIMIIMIVIPLVFLCRNASGITIMIIMIVTPTCFSLQKRNRERKICEVGKKSTQSIIADQKKHTKKQASISCFFINIKIFSNWASISINFAYNKSKDTKYKILRKELKTK